MSLNPPRPNPTSSRLHTLLAATLQWPPEYHGKLTNHLPMALHALHSLGASPQRMRDFYTGYTQRFHGQQAQVPDAMLNVETLEWRTLRGQPSAYPVLLTYFNELVIRERPDTILRRTLPDLLSGICAAAFHGIIRVAHAVQGGHARELAAALTYWAWRWQALQAPPASGAPLGFDRWATRLVQESVGWRSDGSLISLRIADASHSKVYAALAGALAPAPTLAAHLRDMAGLAVSRYVACPNFTVLHMVTGLRAVRTLLPWIEDSVQAQMLLTHAFVAAYMAAQVQPSTAPQEIAAVTWDAVIGAAIASDDDHVIKLVHACREESIVYGDSNYLRAATLATGL